MVRVITQETYDEVVQENIDEFEMSPEEAIKEAVAQFEAQGVDLSNIIKDLALSDNKDHSITSIVQKLEELCRNNDCDSEKLMGELSNLQFECGKDIARRVRAGKEGAYKILIDLLETKYNSFTHTANDKDSECIISTLNTLTSLMDMQPDLLDDRGIGLIKNILDTIENEDILISTLKWLNVCCLKHEMNRQKIFAKNIGDNFKAILTNKTKPRLLIPCLQAIRKFALDDDIRVEFGKAHEHARDLGTLLIETLTGLLKEYPRPPVVGEVLSSAAALLVRHELCSLAAAAAPALFSVLADNYDDAAVTTQATKLITALAGQDDVKRQLVRSGIVPVIVSLLTRHSSSAAASASTLKCISALCLREPAHGRDFLDNGAADPIVACLRTHPDSDAVQKNGCWAIRNIVSRYREQNSKFLELNVQSVLDEAYRRFGKDFGFDIKAALRDLDCDVILDEQWTGRGTQLDN